MLLWHVYLTACTLHFISLLSLSLLALYNKLLHRFDLRVVTSRIPCALKSKINSSLRRIGSLNCVIYNGNVCFFTFYGRLASLFGVPFTGTSYLKTCFVKQARSRELRTQKLKSHSLRTKSIKVLPLKPGVGQYMAIHATLTAWDLFLANFLSFWSIHLHFFKTSPDSSLCWLWPTVLPVWARGIE